MGIAGGVATPGWTYFAQTPEVRARIEREVFANATDQPVAFAVRAAFVLATR